MRIVETLLWGTLLLYSGSSFSREEAGTTQDVLPAGKSADKKRMLTFDVWEYQVKGNTLLDRNIIERAVYNYLGPGRTIKDVEAARKNLEQLYHSRDYQTVLVDIPEQDVRNGVVELKVVEGKIDRVRITGSRYFSLGRIRTQLPSVTRGTVPVMRALQSELNALNRKTPDRQITPVLRPGRSPGSVEVELKVKDEFPVHGSVELNNRNSPSTSSLRSIVTLGYNNLWQKEHSISFSYQVSPREPDDVEVFSGTYVMPLEKPGNTLVFYALKSNSDVATAGDVNVIGKGVVTGMRYMHPFDSVDTYSHSVTLGLDYKSFDEGSIVGGLQEPGADISYLHWSAGYRGSISGKNSRTIFSLGTNYGVRGLVNKQRDFSKKRLGSKANYYYFTAGLDYLYKLPWSLGLVFGFDGQLSSDPLISNEQFSAGGLYSVRGYHESEVLGDDGMRASIELQSSALTGWMPDRYIQTLNVLTFLDGAKIWNDDTLPGEVGSSRLLGAGVGFELQGLGGLNSRFNIAWPLRSENSVESGDLRLHFIVEYRL